jgi:ABC-type uncharacterized transport system permease subunit
LPLRVRLVERAPSERGNPLLYGVAGLVAGLAIAVLLGALTPAGVSGSAAAILGVFASPGRWPGALPYFFAIAAAAGGLALAYRAGFITIGAEGQLVAGMVAAYWALGVAGLPLWAGLLLASLTGLLLGLLVAALRVYFAVNETLSSLMLNYIVVSVLNYLVGGPWSYGGFTRTALLPPGKTLSPLAAAALVTAAVLLLEAVYRFTRLGVAADAVGSARRAAETYGVGFASTVFAVASLGGLVAGLGGGLYLAAVLQQLTSLNTFQSLGYGYMGILAAWLAGNLPAATLASSLLLALLYLASTAFQISRVPWSFALAVQAVIVLSVVTAVTLSRYRIVVAREQG